MKNKTLMLSLIALSSLFVGCGSTTSSSLSSQPVSSSSSSEKINYLIRHLNTLHDQKEKNYTIKYDGGTGDKADIIYCTKNAVYRDANNEVDIEGYAEDENGVFRFIKNGKNYVKTGYQFDENDSYIKDLYSFNVSLGAYKDKVAPVFTSLDVSKYETDLSSFHGQDMIDAKDNDMCYFILCLGWDQTFRKDNTYAYVRASEDTITYEFRGTGGVILTVTIFDIGTTTIEGVENLFNS